VEAKNIAESDDDNEEGFGEWNEGWQDATQQPTEYVETAIDKATE
jgi:hypothetical protein